MPGLPAALARRLHPELALSGAADEYVCALLPLGWEDNAGGFGTVSIAVETQKVHVTHNDRFEDYTTRAFDVEE